ncbi:MAG TPA: hypothetical protein VGJ91_24440 [Polyangiaceae bacterium]
MFGAEAPLDVPAALGGSVFAEVPALAEESLLVQPPLSATSAGTAGSQAKPASACFSELSCMHHQGQPGAASSLKST